MTSISITLLIFFLVGMPLFLLSNAYKTFSKRLKSEYWIYPNKQKQHFMQIWIWIITYIALGVKKWTCLHCGTLHQRDDNAAKNLRSLADRHHRTCKTLNENIILVRKDGLIN